MGTNSVQPPPDVLALVEKLKGIPDLAGVLQKVQANVSVTSDVGAVANCITEICKTLQTDEGQATMKAWRENSIAFNSALVKGWSSLTSTVGGWFK